MRWGLASADGGTSPGHRGRQGGAGRLPPDPELRGDHADAPADGTANRSCWSILFEVNAVNARPLLINYERERNRQTDRRRTDAPIEQTLQTGRGRHTTASNTLCIFMNCGDGIAKRRSLHGSGYPITHEKFPGNPLFPNPIGGLYIRPWLALKRNLSANNVQSSVNHRPVVRGGRERSRRQPRPSPSINSDVEICCRFIL